MDGPRPVVRSVATEVAPPSWAWSEPLPYTRYAGFWRRFVAAWIDGFLIGIVLRILDSIMGRVVEQNQFDPLVSLMWFAIWFVSFITIDWLYYALQESSEYRATLGKRALGIVVTDLSGNRISFGRATGRYFARFLSLITFLIGYLIQPFTKKRQALHDLIAGTLVVRN